MSKTAADISFNLLCMAGDLCSCANMHMQIDSAERVANCVLLVFDIWALSRLPCALGSNRISPGASDRTNIGAE